MPDARIADPALGEIIPAAQSMDRFHDARRSMFGNVDHSFVSPSRKPIFVPTEAGRRVGQTIRRLLLNYSFDAHFRHLRRGGTLAILRRHRENAWFAHADIENFFYSIRRNTVAAALRRAGVREGAHFAKWSTVKNPYGQGYVLPYGFPQSTLLATLVMQESPLGAFLRIAARVVTVEVFVDDISLSDDDPQLLGEVYEGLLAAIAASGFEVSRSKTCGPAQEAVIFNCRVSAGHSFVLEARRAGFYAVPRTEASAARFEGYCRAVAAKSG